MLNREIKINVCQYKEDLENSSSFSTTGKITFSPVRKGLKSKAACCVVEVDDGIIDYYRNQLNNYYGLNLIRPSWSAHVSIIQGSIDPESKEYKDLIKQYEGMEVSLKYKIFPRFNGDTSESPSSHKDGSFWFLTVELDLFKEIRDKINLDTSFLPHLTIGKR